MRWLGPATLTLAGMVLLLSGYAALQTAAGLAVLRSQRCAGQLVAPPSADCAEVDPSPARGTRAMWLLGSGAALLAAALATALLRRGRAT